MAKLFKKNEELKNSGGEAAVVSNPKDKSSKKPQDKKKKNKEPKAKKLGKAVKETTSELKKVTWPKFGEVSKKTGVVLVVVLIFGALLLLIDFLLGLLFGLLK